MPGQKRPPHHLELLVLAEKTGTAFDPETIDLMGLALQKAISELPEQVGSKHAQLLAKSILRQAAAGERDVSRLCDGAFEEMRQSSQS